MEIKIKSTKIDRGTWVQPLVMPLNKLTDPLNALPQIYGREKHTSHVTEQQNNFPRPHDGSYYSTVELSFGGRYK
jgi:hypothetical protein